MILMIKAKEVLQVCLEWDDKCNLNVHVSVTQWYRGLTTFDATGFYVAAKAYIKM